MLTTLIRLTLGLVLAAVAITCPAFARQGSVPAAIRLTGHDLVSNVVFMRAEGDTGDARSLPRIRMRLANTTDRPLWGVLILTPPIQDRAYDRRGHIAPKDDVQFICTQDSVVAGADYRIDVYAFADSQYADTLERNTWSVQLDKSSVATWNRRHELDLELERAKVLPCVYDRIVVKAESGAVASLTGNGGRWKHGGRLTVSHGGLEYESERSSFKLTAAQLVTAEWDIADNRVKLEYEDAGGRRKIGFLQSGITKNRLYELETSIREVIRRRSP